MRFGLSSSLRWENDAHSRLHASATSSERWSTLSSIYFVVIFNLAAWSLIVFGAMRLM